MKVRAKINEIEMKETIPKINETKSSLFEKILLKIDQPQPDYPRGKKGKGLKSIKL